MRAPWTIGLTGLIAVVIVIPLATPREPHEQAIPHLPEVAAAPAPVGTVSDGPDTNTNPSNSPEAPVALSLHISDCPWETICFPNGHREAVRWRGSGVPQTAEPVRPPYAPHMPALLARAESGDDGAALQAYDILTGCARSPEDPSALERAIALMVETHQLEDPVTGWTGRVEATKIDEWVSILRQGYADCAGVQRLGEAERLNYLAIAAAGPTPYARMRYAKALGESDPVRTRQLHEEAWDLGYLEALPAIADHLEQDYQAGVNPEGLIEAMAARYVYASLYHAYYGMDEARIIGRHVRRLLEGVEATAAQLRAHELATALERAQTLRADRCCLGM